MYSRPQKNEPALLSWFDPFQFFHRWYFWSESAFLCQFSISENLASSCQKLQTITSIQCFPELFLAVWKSLWSCVQTAGSCAAINTLFVYPLLSTKDTSVFLYWLVIRRGRAWEQPVSHCLVLAHVSPGLLYPRPSDRAHFILFLGFLWLLNTSVFHVYKNQKQTTKWATGSIAADAGKNKRKFLFFGA